MLELLLSYIASLGKAETQSILCSAGESLLKKYKDSCRWKKLFVETGEFYIKNEQEEIAFFCELKSVLSKDSLSRIASDLKNEDGYVLKHKLYEAFMELMRKYEIPYEIADLYTTKIIYAVLEQVRTIDPQKFGQYFLQEWREEQKQSFLELQNRVDKMSNELAIYNREQVAIASSGTLDVELRKSTHSPSIGIDFFVVDDERFQDEFGKLRYEKEVFIRGHNIEETVFCVLNELWRLDEKRPIYVVKNLESWNKLQAMKNEGNIYIPWFYADEIVAIEKNTNIFVADENTPLFRKSVLELRPRTYDTLMKCLHAAGLKHDEAWSLISDTHGLYSQMKKKMFNGECLKTPTWMTGISERAKKTCLLIGSWEEIEGDKLVIESIYEDSYDRFIEEVLPYVKGEDPFLYMLKRNGTVSYYLASTENVWSYLDVLTNEKIWSLFISAVLEVINEPENLFTYNSGERVLAQFNGEKLFWSETIREGMLKTLLIKGAYRNDKDTQSCLNKLVEDILKNVETEKQWIYISKFWKELCEISPVVVMNRIEHEWVQDTGLLSLFKNQSSDFIFERNSYINILWGIELLITQKDFFWPAFRWLLRLDEQQYKYESSSPKLTFEKVFCPWANFSPLQTAEEKIEAAEIALKIDYVNTWEYLFSAIYDNRSAILGELSEPKYREHYRLRSTTMMEMRKTYDGYFKLLLQYLAPSAERWRKMIDLSSKLTEDRRRNIFGKLSYEIVGMPDEEIMQIKNEVRHLIYEHRYYASSDWSLSEDNIAEYEKLLNNIHTNTVEYEYVYLFTKSFGFPLLHPTPYDGEESRSENEKIKENLIKEKITEFQNMNYNLTTLAKMCADESYSTLGNYLAKYWSEGKWNYEVFKCLLEAQESGQIAINYLEAISEERRIEYSSIIEDLTINDYPKEIVAKVYRIEAIKTKEIPLITYAAELIKKKFWKYCINCDKVNDSWVISECKKYATLNVYLEQLNRIHYRNPLSSEKIFECFGGIEEMPRFEADQMASYYVQQLICVVQDAYIDDPDKCNRIAQIEFFFMNLLKWDQMKCLHHMIKQSPELFAQIVSVIFKKDHALTENEQEDNKCFDNMFTLYDKAHFCPAENDGKVNEEKLEDWVEQYKRLLIKNDQESMFMSTLGRLFSFSPVSDDGYEPCVAVRRLIEKYGDDKLINAYKVAAINRRGIYSPSAGKEELQIAEKYKRNAEFLEPQYPKTAQIFYGLFERYSSESEQERMNAENGWY